MLVGKSPSTEDILREVGIENFLAARDVAR